jgi:hypothetical protein
MYTREQIVLRAEQTVREMQAMLEGERLVARFVDSYVSAFGRKGLKASPLRYRELLSTISREVWLVLAAKMSAVLPNYLARGTLRPRSGSARARSRDGRESKGKRILRAADAEAADGFRESFFEALAAALRWTPAELEAFRHDLALYLEIFARQPQAMKSRAQGQPPEGPFVDRCGFLLDPSLLDKARQAAGQFQAELEQVAERILQSIFRTRSKD